MKKDNYFYINNNDNFYLDDNNIIENFSMDIFEGPKGNTGDIGYDGTRGLQGLQGTRGIKGNQGIPGDQGPKGYRGLVGETGDKGKKGIDGGEGNDGIQGFVGPRGDFGPRGPSGPQGEKGPTGALGPTGFMGPKGNKGDPGRAGRKEPPNANPKNEPFIFTSANNDVMTGFFYPADKSTRLFNGQVANPFKKSTVEYKYEFDRHTQLVCPPNSYLVAFGFSRKDNGTSRDTLDSNGNVKKNGAGVPWCKKDKACRVGPQERGCPTGRKSGTGFGCQEGNQWRQGLPWHFKGDCMKLF